MIRKSRGSFPKFSSAIVQALVVINSIQDGRPRRLAHGALYSDVSVEKLVFSSPKVQTNSENSRTVRVGYRDSNGLMN